jgi:hypothetical protein
MDPRLIRGEHYTPNINQLCKISELHSRCYVRVSGRSFRSFILVNAPRRTYFIDLRVSCKLAHIVVAFVTNPSPNIAFINFQTRIVIEIHACVFHISPCSCCSPRHENTQTFAQANAETLPYAASTT